MYIKLDTELEWTYRCTDDELIKIAQESIEKSKKIYEEAEKNIKVILKGISISETILIHSSMLF